MKTHRQELWFEVPGVYQYRAAGIAVLQQGGIQEGLCLVNAMHISASVFINDDEAGLYADLERWLEKLAPEKPHSQYAHNSAES